MSRVLIIDDEPSFREVLRCVLSSAGHVVMGCPDGESALGEFLEFEADLVITDFRMAGMNGVEVLRELQEIDPFVPVILLTGLIEELDAAEIARLGAFACLDKLFVGKELARIVSQALHHRPRRRRTG